MELGRRGSRSETVVGVLAGLTVGYIGWLVAVSIGSANATVSVWGFAVLGASILLAACGALWGRRLRHRRNYPLAAFAFALPLLPVVLTISVLTYTYV